MARAASPSARPMKPNHCGRSNSSAPPRIRRLTVWTAREAVAGMGWGSCSGQASLFAEQGSRPTCTRRARRWRQGRGLARAARGARHLTTVPEFPMLIHLSSWPEIDARLKSTKTVIVPIGSNEQHGPTGLLGTDWLCPEIIAHAAEKQDEQIVVAPTFNIGMAQHHLAFAGTISLRPSTFMAAITDWVSSLNRHGFERIYFLNGHGGNVATIEATFAEIYAEWSFLEERAPFALKLKNWWDLPGVHGLCTRMFPTGHG